MRDQHMGSFCYCAAFCAFWLWAALLVPLAVEISSKEKEALAIKVFQNQSQIRLHFDHQSELLHSDFNSDAKTELMTAVGHDLHHGTKVKFLSNLLKQQEFQPYRPHFVDVDGASAWDDTSDALVSTVDWNVTGQLLKIAITDDECKWPSGGINVIYDLELAGQQSETRLALFFSNDLNQMDWYLAAPPTDQLQADSMRDWSSQLDSKHWNFTNGCMSSGLTSIAACAFTKWDWPGADQQMARGFHVRLDSSKAIFGRCYAVGSWCGSLQGGTTETFTGCSDEHTVTPKTFYPALRVFLALVLLCIYINSQWSFFVQFLPAFIRLPPAYGVPKGKEKSLLKFNLETYHAVAWSAARGEASAAVVRMAITNAVSFYRAFMDEETCHVEKGSVQVPKYSLFFYNNSDFGAEFHFVFDWCGKIVRLLPDDGLGGNALQAVLEKLSDDLWHDCDSKPGDGRDAELISHAYVLRALAPQMRVRSPEADVFKWLGIEYVWALLCERGTGGRGNDIPAKMCEYIAEDDHALLYAALEQRHKLWISLINCFISEHSQGTIPEYIRARDEAAREAKKSDLKRLKDMYFNIFKGVGAPPLPIAPISDDSSEDFYLARLFDASVFPREHDALDRYHDAYKRSKNVPAHHDRQPDEAHHGQQSILEPLAGAFAKDCDSESCGHSSSGQLVFKFSDRMEFRYITQKVETSKASALKDAIEHQLDETPLRDCFFCVNDVRHAFNKQFWVLAFRCFFNEKNQLRERLRFVQFRQNFQEDMRHREDEDTLNMVNVWYYGLGGIVRDMVGGFTSCGTGALWRLHPRILGTGTRAAPEKFCFQLDTVTEDCESSIAMLLEQGKAHCECSKYLNHKVTASICKTSDQYMVAQTRWALGGLQNWVKWSAHEKVGRHLFAAIFLKCWMWVIIGVSATQGWPGIEATFSPALPSAGMGPRNVVAVVMYWGSVLVVLLAYTLNGLRWNQLVCAAAIENDLVYPLFGLVSPLLQLFVIPSLIAITGVDLGPFLAGSAVLVWFLVSLMLQAVIKKAVIAWLSCTGQNPFPEKCEQVHKFQGFDDEKLRTLRERDDSGQEGEYSWISFCEWVTMWPLHFCAIFKVVSQKKETWSTDWNVDLVGCEVYTFRRISLAIACLLPPVLLFAEWSTSNLPMSAGTTVLFCLPIVVGFYCASALSGIEGKAMKALVGIFKFGACTEARKEKLEKRGRWTARLMVVFCLVVWITLTANHFDPWFFEATPRLKGVLLLVIPVYFSLRILGFSPRVTYVAGLQSAEVFLCFALLHFSVYSNDVEDIPAYKFFVALIDGNEYVGHGVIIFLETGIVLVVMMIGRLERRLLGRPLGSKGGSEANGGGGDDLSKDSDLQEPTKATNGGSDSGSQDVAPLSALSPAALPSAAAHATPVVFPGGSVILRSQFAEGTQDTDSQQDSQHPKASMKPTVDAVVEDVVVEVVEVVEANTIMPSQQDLDSERQGEMKPTVADDVVDEVVEAKTTMRSQQDSDSERQGEVGKIISGLELLDAVMLVYQSTWEGDPDKLHKFASAKLARKSFLNLKFRVIHDIASDRIFSLKPADKTIVSSKPDRSDKLLSWKELQMTCAQLCSNIKLGFERPADSGTEGSRPEGQQTLDCALKLALEGFEEVRKTLLLDRHNSKVLKGLVRNRGVLLQLASEMKRNSALWYGIRYLRSVSHDLEGLKGLESNVDWYTAVVMEAVKQNGQALQHVSMDLLAAVKHMDLLATNGQNGQAFVSEDEWFKKVLLTAVNQDAFALEHVSAPLTSVVDCKVVACAIQQNGEALQLCNKLKHMKQWASDREVVLQAIKTSHGVAALYASDSVWMTATDKGLLQWNLGFVEHVLVETPEAWKHLPAKLFSVLKTPEFFARVYRRRDDKRLTMSIRMFFPDLPQELCNRVQLLIQKGAGPAGSEQKGDHQQHAPPTRKLQGTGLGAVEQDGERLSHASTVWQSRERALAAVEQNGIALRHAPRDLKSDRVLVLAAVEQNGEALQYALRDLKSDRFVVLTAVEQNGKSLLYASYELKADADVVLAAVEQNGEALQYASRALKSRHDVVQAAVEHNAGTALRYASRALRNDRGLVLAAVEQNGEALQYASRELKESADVVIVAVEQNGDALQHSAAHFKKTGDSQERLEVQKVVLAAVKQNGKALQYAGEWRKDEVVVRAAFEQNANALQYASDEEVVLAVVKQNGNALQYAGEWQKVEAVVRAAFAQNANALQYASDELKWKIDNESSRHKSEGVLSKGVLSKGVLLKGVLLPKTWQGELEKYNLNVYKSWYCQKVSGEACVCTFCKCDEANQELFFREVDEQDVAYLTTKKMLRKFVAFGWDSADAEIFQRLARPQMRAAMFKFPELFKECKKKLRTILYKQAMKQREQFKGSPADLYRHLKGNGSLAADDEVWSRMVPNIRFQSPVVTKGWRGSKNFTEKGVKVILDDPSILDPSDRQKKAEDRENLIVKGDIVCFKSSGCTTKWGSMQEAILTSGHDAGAFPPDTIFCLIGEKKAGEWVAPGGFVYDDLKLLIVEATYIAPAGVTGHPGLLE